jgi:hypothetical protein
MFAPVLLYLAMLASSEPGPDGIIASSWLARREFVVHVAHRAGIESWTYPVGCVTPCEAIHYLVELTRDFLDGSQFDLLPFEVLCKNQMLKAALEPAMPKLAAEPYRVVFEDEVAEARENTFGGTMIPPLIDMIGAQVPADAAAKVSRRFQLLVRPLRGSLPGQNQAVKR